MIGRDKEVRKLRRVVSKLNQTDSPHPRVLILEGEEGVGKTRYLIGIIRYVSSTYLVCYTELICNINRLVHEVFGMVKQKGRNIFLGTGDQVSYLSSSSPSPSLSNHDKLSRIMHRSVKQCLTLLSLKYLRTSSSTEQVIYHKYIYNNIQHLFIPLRLLANLLILSTS